MSEDEEISFDTPRLWRVCKFDPSEPLPAGMRSNTYRIQRGTGESLTGPTLINLVGEDGAAQVKILYGQQLLVLINDPSSKQQEGLLQVMTATADALNEEEMDGGQFETDQARLRAGAIARDVLPKYLGD